MTTPHRTAGHYLVNANSLACAVVSPTTVDHVGLHQY